MSLLKFIVCIVIFTEAILSYLKSSGSDSQLMDAICTPFGCHLPFKTGLITRIVLLAASIVSFVSLGWFAELLVLALTAAAVYGLSVLKKKRP